MRYPFLGRSALRVSRLGLGCFNFGDRTDEATAFEIMDQALEAGINLFDTADMYAAGQSETIIGRWLAQGGGRREKIVLATKVWSGSNRWPNRFGLSAVHIRQACEASLRRLQTDHIDLYQFHHVDRHAPWEEVWQAMELLIAQGKVLYIGCSNFAAWNMVLGNETAKRRGMLGLVSDQSHYNLLIRLPELEMIPACEALGVAVLPYSPLRQGVLGGVLDRPADGRRSTPFTESRVAPVRAAIEAWEALCASLGTPPGEVALAWLLHQPAVTAPMIGPRTPSQLTSALKSLDIRLEPETLDRLDEIFPGPGGEAPEAYTTGFPRNPLRET
jgi:aryl-alcohol dehydrogenase-like predicted oxidoreductase